MKPDQNIRVMGCHCCRPDPYRNYPTARLKARYSDAAFIRNFQALWRGVALSVPRHLRRRIKKALLEKIDREPGSRVTLRCEEVAGQMCFEIGKQEGPRLMRDFERGRLPL